MAESRPPAGVGMPSIAASTSDLPKDNSGADLDSGGPLVYFEGFWVDLCCVRRNLGLSGLNSS